MTYEEAQNEINRYYDALFPRMPRKIPPVDVLGTFVTVKAQILMFHRGLYEGIRDRGKDNWEQLEFLGCLHDDLTPYVCAKMWGYEIFYPLEEFLMFLRAFEGVENNPT